MKPSANQQENADFEDEHVHQVYNEIASHFSSTRFKPWPVVDEFLKGLPVGSVGLDIGCGNGKYLTVRQDVFILASDRSEELLRFATRHPPHSAVVADVLNLPHPDNMFDFTICIAMIHHLSTPQRRQEGIGRILDTLRLTPANDPHAGRLSFPPTTRPGQALIFVWALEQKNSRRGWDTGMEQDVMVPWVLKSEHDKSRGIQDEDRNETNGKKATQANLDPPTEGHKTFHRYYHLYRKGELEGDVVAAGGKIIRQGYDRDNWWVVCERDVA